MNVNLAVHRTIIGVDVERFGDEHRTNRDQVAVRDGLYRAMQGAFRRAGIPWAACDHEDRGDGMFILVSPEVHKSLFVESLPPALVLQKQPEIFSSAGVVESTGNGLVAAAPV